MQRKFPVIPTLICLMGVTLLCGLGFWQIERLQWKNNLQAELDKAFALQTPDRLNVNDIKTLRKGTMLRGRLDGEFLDSPAAIFMGRIKDGRAVQSVVQPFQIKGTDTIIAVETGCSAKRDLKNATAKTVTGLIRTPTVSYFLPDNSSSQNEWWNFDIGDLSAYWGHQNILPVLMTAENVEFPCPVEKKLRNDHLSYAIFWFTMAGVLCVMWVLRFLKRQ